MKKVYSLYNAGQMVCNSDRKQSTNNVLGTLLKMILVLRTVARRLERKRMDILTAVAYLYSMMLGEVVTPKKAALLLKAQVAFLGILVFAYSPLLCIACVVWFAKSLINIKVSYN